MLIVYIFYKLFYLKRIEAFDNCDNEKKDKKCKTAICFRYPKETGLADLAYKAESDHEVQMARGDLYKIAKYAIKLHEMLKGVEEREGLDGWVQSKITKAADYIGSV